MRYQAGAPELVDPAPHRGLVPVDGGGDRGVARPAAPRVASMVRQGQVGQLLASLPPARRGVVAGAVRSAFAAGLNDLLIVTAVLAFAGAVCALLLIRGQDFVRTGGGEPQAAAVRGDAAGADRGSPARSA